MRAALEPGAGAGSAGRGDPRAREAEGGAAVAVGDARKLEEARVVRGEAAGAAAAAGDVAAAARAGDALLKTASRSGPS